MNSKAIFLAAALTAGLAVAAPVDEVDPFIGTGGNGHTTPAAAYPLGLVQAGPDTGNGDWGHCSGYAYGDSELYGFSQTHLSGTGCMDLGDIRILPFTGKKVPEKVKFDKASETARPGYYAVTLKDGTRVEIAAAPHSAIYRLTFKESGIRRILVDSQWGLVGWEALPRHIKSFDSQEVSATGLSGRFTAHHWSERTMAFDLVFDRPAIARHRVKSRKKGEKAARFLYDFELSAGETLMIKVGLSVKDVQAARLNLTAEIPAWDFDGVAAAARTAWNERLTCAQVKGSKAVRRVWYTGLYHLYFQPNNLADVGEKPFYSTFSCWDIFRAAGPLYTIFSPETSSAFVDSMLAQGRITGYLPVWTLGGFDNQCMIGTHSIPMIVDWFFKEGAAGSRGSTPDYWEDAYRQIKDTLTQKHERRHKEQWELYDKYGYYPFDEIRGESVSRTVECSYDDWCAAQMAAALGHAEDAKFFLKRSNYWKNVFDPELKKLRGRDTKGEWRTPFNPFALGHDGGRANDFTEGNSFQYTWHVLQDADGLIAAMGGKDAFIKELDALFAQPTEAEGMGTVADCTGLIGQYAHGNEPSHHVAYLYTVAGAPEKTASRVHEICSMFYSEKPDGLCGNEDCGQMSAWYLFSARGFYPLNPCGGEYVIGAPQLERVELKVGGADKARKFVVKAKNFGKKNKYVKSVTLNGKPITDWRIRHEDIMKGGELVFEMAPILDDVASTVHFTSGGDRFRVAVDCIAAPDLQPWVETKMKPVLEEWLVRLVDDFACEGYAPKTNFVCTLCRDLNCPGSSDGVGLNLNATYIRGHLDDTGMVIHEIWHQLQNYTSKHPSWLAEGIDDWVRYYHVEKKPPKVDPKTAKADGGYWNTAAFLEWCGGRPFVSELITALRQGRYTSDWWKAKTGRTFDELAADWAKQGL